MDILTVISSETFKDILCSRVLPYESLTCMETVEKRSAFPSGSADQNVFDIMQGVSILVFLKRVGHNDKASVLYADLWGDREKKYRLLWAENCSEDWVAISPKAAPKMFVPVQSSTDDWDAALPLVECFGTGN
jgi:hypothetical protein